MLIDLRKSWLPEVGYLLALALITYAVWKGWTAPLDEDVRSFVLSIQADWSRVVAYLFNLFGQGWMVCWVLSGGMTVLLLYRTRSWKALLPWATVFAMTYLTAGPMKVWSDRAAPSSVFPNRVELFNPLADGKFAMSYPSGHVVNAIIWWAAIVVLASTMWELSEKQIRWMRIAPPIIVVITTTYLNYHWLTDGLAAVALGLFLNRLFHRVNWKAILPSALPAPR